MQTEFQIPGPGAKGKMVTTEAAEAITSSNDPKIKLPGVSTKRGGRLAYNFSLLV
jgi:hypothetical protein